MNMQHRRPLIVWTTVSVLAISSAMFGIALIGAVFVYHEGRISHLQPALLLVAMPLIGLVGLIRRKLWGRDVALLALASLWAFTLHGFLSIYSEREFEGIQMRTFVLFFFLVALLLFLPNLFARLRWGTASKEFFRNGVSRT